VSHVLKSLTGHRFETSHLTRRFVVSHPLPNLSVNVIYPLLWLLLTLWWITIAVIMWRAYRHLAARLPAIASRWRVVRSAPTGPTEEVRLLLEAPIEAAPLARPEPPAL
jgi:hypothetical protein